MSGAGDSSYTPQDQPIDEIGLINQTPVAQPSKIVLSEEMVQLNNNSYSNEDRDTNRRDHFQRDMPLSQSGITYNHHHVPGNDEPHSRYPHQYNHPSDANSQQENTTPNEDNASNSSSLSLDDINQSTNLDGSMKKDGSRQRKRSLTGSEGEGEGEGKQDQAYWEKRRKNNESAKRSRDARRMKEEQIAMRVVYLEQENLQLRTEAQLLKSEIDKLRSMLYNMQ